MTDDPGQGPNEPDEPRRNGTQQWGWMPLGIALGVGIGTALGVAMNNIGSGIAIGIGIGLALGLAFREAHSQRRKRD
jgi:hypothetical protein